MTLPIEKLIFKPSVTPFARTAIINEGFDECIAQLDVEGLAQDPYTPIGDMAVRIFSSGEKFGGDLDDVAEFAGRQCYRSWARGRGHEEYIENILADAHGSVLAHASVSLLITGVSRSFSHELVRHAIGTGISQESQRYVDAKDIKFVVPPVTANAVAGMPAHQALMHPEIMIFRDACQYALDKYMLYQGAINERLGNELASIKDAKQATSAKKRANEAARALLGNAAETRLVYTMNMRALWHILRLRGTEFADLEIRRWAIETYERTKEFAPAMLKHIEVYEGSDGLPALHSGFGKV